VMEGMLDEGAAVMVTCVDALSFSATCLPRRVSCRPVLPLHKPLARLQFPAHLR
jgi:hypothetical protein